MDQTKKNTLKPLLVVLLFAVSISAHSEQKKRFINKEEDPEYLKSIYTKLDGYDEVKAMLTVDNARLGDINSLPCSLYLQLAGNKKAVVDCAWWFNPVEKDKPRYNWNDFLNIYMKVNTIVEKYPWVRKWREQKTGRTVDAEIFGITPSTETDPDYFVRPAWEDAGLPGEDLYEVLLRDGSNFTHVFFSKESDRALITSDTTEDITFHPNSATAEYVIVSADGSRKKVIKDQVKRPPENYFFERAKKYAKLNDSERTISALLNLLRWHGVPPERIEEEGVLKPFLKDERVKAKLAEAKKPANAIEPDWVALDKTEAAEVLNCLPVIEKGIEPFFKSFKKIYFDKERNIGHNTMIYTAQTSGGYTTFNITVVAYKDQIARARISSYTFKEIDFVKDVLQPDPAFKRMFESYFKKNAEEDNRFVFNYSSNSISEKLRCDFAEEFGAIKEESMSPENRRAFVFLCDPIEQLHYGSTCGEDPVELPGLIAAEKLEENKQYGVLTSITRGCNPEGRVFAVEALLRAAAEKKYELAGEDKSQIAKVLHLNLPIICCHGCIVTSQNMPEVIKNPALKELLEQNGIKY